MNIKKRKIREVGNSIVVTLSRESLLRKGLKPGDTIFIDEDKMMDAIVKEESNSDFEIDMYISQALSEYDAAFMKLVDR
ncbi:MULTISPECIES: AbrB/MazE/SpoVT family DNA-binding domain-containing protein [Enterococcus]|uniref:AbrB/MazE/SpoVT family DNA-binding domain-containing protein n=1 Tax=Enterococcus TaxID=1350 RepID=UPI000EB0AC1E|nr:MULTISPECIES: AbrB/MazE/SpoVT family DNA-binding domain-containing protein [Enterococcus]AYJ46990.1 addiction module antitoxin [Enterococcus casseliflavus]EGP4932640.1 addiction module antitoxin [Enterococcus faecium]GEB68635.1 addiction module antitoxin [Enterococcus faecalis]